MGEGHKIFWAGLGCCTYELVAVVTELTGPSLVQLGGGPCMEGRGFGHWLDSCWPLATGRQRVVVSAGATTLGIPWFLWGKEKGRGGRLGLGWMGRRW